MSNVFYLPSAVDNQALVARSTKLIGARALSVEELRQRLLAENFPAGEVEVEIERLLQIGALDDEALAERLVEKYSKRYSASVVARKLIERRIPREIAETAVAGIAQDSEIEKIRLIVEKFARQGKNISDYQDRAKIMQSLQRKGFRQELILRAIEK